jgi:hypothetical protein
MEQMDMKVFMALMGTLSVAYGENLPAERVEIYYECLRDIPPHELKQAVYALLKTRKFPNFPTIAEIRERALGTDQDIESAALAAWHVALTRYHGNGDKLLDEAIEMAFGGWDGWDGTYIENQVSDRAHFIRCYKAVAQKRFAERTLPQLPPEPKKLESA